MGKQPVDRGSVIAAAVTTTVLGLPLWFLIHLPLFPSTLAGWAAAISSYGVAVVACFLLVPALSWAEQRGALERVRAVLGAVLACSLGVGIFMAEWVWRDFISHNFQKVHLF